MAGIVGCAVAAHDVGAAGEHIIRNRHCIGIPTRAGKDCRQRGAAVEHILHIGHRSCIEAAQVERRKLAAAVEHAAHISNLGGVEGAHVEGRQLTAAVEHAVHIGDFFGMEVFQSADVHKVAHSSEPRECRRGTLIVERSIKHHMDYSLTVGIPSGVGVAGVQHVDIIAISRAVTVVAEHEGACAGVETHIDAHMRLVAKVTGGFQVVDMRVSNSCVARRVSSVGSTHKRGAVQEHGGGSSHHGVVPTRAYVDGLEVGTALEHARHGGYLGGVESRQVEFCQAGAVAEHITHVGHCTGVEVF